MTAEELVDAVAGAMFEAATGAGYAPFNAQPPATQASFRAMARAALRVVREAMREPDEAMRAACRATTGAIITRKHCDEMWQGMLAASPLGRIDA